MIPPTDPPGPDEGAARDADAGPDEGAGRGADAGSDEGADAGSHEARGRDTAAGSGGVRDATAGDSATSGARSSPMSPAPPDLVCELCGGPVLERHCKILCLNCGFQRDCSDP